MKQRWICEIKTFHAKAHTSYPLDIYDLQPFKRKINSRVVPRTTLPSEMKFRQVVLTLQEKMTVMICRRLNQ